jgi:hypothetical protein
VSEGGVRTYTQVKRQLSVDEQWTAPKLVANGVIKAFGTQLRNQPTARCEFYSTLSASHLQDLTECAVLADSLQEFEDVFAGAEDKKKSCGDVDGGGVGVHPTDNYLVRDVRRGCACHAGGAFLAEGSSGRTGQTGQSGASGQAPIRSCSARPEPWGTGLPAAGQIKARTVQ